MKSQTVVELFEEDITSVLSKLYGDPKDLKVYITHTINGTPVVSAYWTTRPEDLEAGERV